LTLLLIKRSRLEVKKTSIIRKPDRSLITSSLDFFYHKEIFSFV
jgi:hypothetical protein